MKGNKYVSSCILCPCYKHHNRSAIYCLPVEDAASIVVTFKDSSDRKRFMKKHCYPPRDSSRCPLYSVLCRRFQGADDG